MQSPDTTTAPLVPPVSTDPETDSGAHLASDGGRPATRTFDRPPRTDYATAYTRDEEEI